MKIGFFLTFLALTVTCFETSGDGTTDPDAVVNNVINVNNVVNIVIDTETSSVASVVVNSGVCAGKCDSLPNTECVIVQSNSNGYACPCIAGFELNNAGQCTVSGNTVAATTSTTATTSETTNPKTIDQTGVTLSTGENILENSTPNSGTILASLAGVLLGALFL